MSMGTSQSRDSSTVGPAKVAAIALIAAAISAGVTFSVLRQPVRVVRDPEVVYVLPPAPERLQSSDATTKPVEAVSSVRAAQQLLSKVEPVAVAAEAVPVVEMEQTESAAAPAGKINLNTATQAELELLPDIGPKTAQAILDYRKAKGRFKTIADLDKVKGIGERTLKKLAPLVTVD